MKPYQAMAKVAPSGVDASISPSLHPKLDDQGSMTRARASGDSIPC